MPSQAAHNLLECPDMILIIGIVQYQEAVFGEVCHRCFNDLGLFIGLVGKLVQFLNQPKCVGQLIAHGRKNTVFAK